MGTLFGTARFALCLRKGQNVARGPSYSSPITIKKWIGPRIIALLLNEISIPFRRYPIMRRKLNEWNGRKLERREWRDDTVSFLRFQALQT